MLGLLPLLELSADVLSSRPEDTETETVTTITTIRSEHTPDTRSRSGLIGVWWWWWWWAHTAHPGR